MTMKLSIATLLFAAVAFAQPPYAAPAVQTVCVMNMTATPPAPAVDPATSLPKCFIVPVAVVDATNSFMLDQKTTAADGTVAYTYANWWDLIVKHFVNSL